MTMPLTRTTGPGLSGTERRKLQRLIRHAVRYVPMYRELYAPLELTKKDFADPDLFRRLPLVSKNELVSVPPRDRVDQRLDIRSLVSESTTGSTGQPFSLYLDRRYRRLRNLRFLRALLTVGYRPWERLLLLTDRHSGSSRRRNWYYESVEQPTANLVEAYHRVRPGVLYGFATPLRLLAERLLETGRPAGPGPHLVVSTAEVLDPVTRRILTAAFGCPIYDFYGMTETGLAAWQQPGLDGYAVARNAVLMELVADGHCEGRYRVVMTNLDLRASPIIRFDCGDLALAETVDGELRVKAFEGRRIDTIAHRDGSVLSPYRITDAFRDIPGLRRFRVIQNALTAFHVELEAEGTARERTASAVRRVLGELLGAGLELHVVFRDRLTSDGVRKFRPVESRLVRTTNEAVAS